MPRGARDRIAFQGDHALPRPTSGWRKGETIVDGPHVLTVSGEGDAFDLVGELAHDTLGRGKVERGHGTVTSTQMRSQSRSVWCCTLFGR